MGIKEILAAKQAAKEALTLAQAQAAAPGLATSDPVAHQQAITDAAADAEAEKAVSPLDMEEAPAPAAAPVVPADRPMTFAEKLASKKGLVAAAQSKPPAPPPKAVIDSALIPEDEEDAQAYVDIKNKIEALAVVDGDDLRNSMSELKAALKKNAAACELMLDEDLGKMVIALRRMTHVAIEEAKTPTKKAAKAPKTKDVALTKEQIEAAFADL